MGKEITLMTDEELKPFIPDGISMDEVVGVTFIDGKPTKIHLTGFRHIKITEVKDADTKKRRD